MASGSDDSKRAEIDRLIEAGLAAFAQGHLEDAVLAWKQVLLIAPADERANAHLAYAREQAAFLKGGARTPTGDGTDVDGYGLQDDAEAYLDYDLDLVKLGKASSVPLVADRLDSLDEGWTLEDAPTAMTMSRVTTLDMEKSAPVAVLVSADPSVVVAPEAKLGMGTNRRPRPATVEPTSGLAAVAGSVDAPRSDTRGNGDASNRGAAQPVEDMPSIMIDQALFEPEPTAQRPAPVTAPATAAAAVDRASTADGEPDDDENTADRNAAIVGKPVEKTDSTFGRQTASYAAIAEAEKPVTVIPWSEVSKPQIAVPHVGAVAHTVHSRVTRESLPPAAPDDFESLEIEYPAAAAAPDDETTRARRDSDEYTIEIAGRAVTAAERTAEVKAEKVAEATAAAFPSYAEVEVTRDRAAVFEAESTVQFKASRAHRVSDIDLGSGLSADDAIDRLGAAERARRASTMAPPIVAPPVLPTTDGVPEARNMNDSGEFSASEQTTGTAHRALGFVRPGNRRRATSNPDFRMSIRTPETARRELGELSLDDLEDRHDTTPINRDSSRGDGIDDNAGAPEIVALEVVDDAAEEAKAEAAAMAAASSDEKLEQERVNQHRRSNATLELTPGALGAASHRAALLWQSPGVDGSAQDLELGPPMGEVVESSRVDERKSGLDLDEPDEADDEDAVPTAAASPFVAAETKSTSRQTQDFGPRNKSLDAFEDIKTSTSRPRRDSQRKFVPGGTADSDPLGMVRRELEHEVDINAPAVESSDEASRRRVAGYLTLASRASRLDDHSRAVIAVELAQVEDPDSAAAHKIIHRERDNIVAIYQGQLGNLEARPRLSRPFHELAGEAIEARAAFLLSRIDGTMSFEEIIDVSGMPRIEALRYLSTLLVRGILTVRR